MLSERSGFLSDEEEKQNKGWHRYGSRSGIGGYGNTRKTYSYRVASFKFDNRFNLKIV